MPHKMTKGARLRLLALLAALLGLMLWLGSQKIGYHVDEVATYHLSNSDYISMIKYWEPEYTPAQFVQDYLLGDDPVQFAQNMAKDVRDVAQNGLRGSEVYRAFKSVTSDATGPQSWHTGEWIKDCFTVQPGQRFAVSRVYWNQMLDTHPPLFYLAVNFVSGLFAGQFSKWLVLGVNLLCMLAAAAVLYRMIRRSLGGEALALLAVAFYGGSMAFANTFVYLRMYAMLTLWVVCFAALNLQLLQKDWAMPRRWRVLFVLCVVAGFNTHYYFALFAVSMGIVALAQMAFARAWKALGRYVGLAALSVAVSLVLWPFSVKHILGGQRGGGGLSLSRMVTGLQAYPQVLRDNFLAGSTLLLAVVLLAAVLLLVLHRGLPGGAWLLAGLPVALYLLLLSAATPVTSPQYAMCIFPLVALLLAALAERLFQKLPLPGPAGPKWALSLTAACLAALCIAGALRVEPYYLYQSQSERIELARQSEGQNVVGIYLNEDANDWVWTSATIDMQYYQKSALINVSRMDWLAENYDCPAGTTLVVYLYRELDQRATLDALYKTCGIDPVCEEQLPADSDIWSTVYKIQT